MRLIAFAAIGLLAACQQPAEQSAQQPPEDQTRAGTLVGNAAPPTREAALKLMHERHEHMEDIGDATKLVSRELKKGQPDVAAIQGAAASIATLAPRVPAWFPAGTGPDVGKTHALPAIWEKREDFASKSRDFEAAAKTFDAAAQSGDLAVIRASFGELGKSCKACHDSYRAKDD
jgi:cytochrome c556